MTYFLSKIPIAALTLLLVATLCFILIKLAGEEAAFGERNPPPEVRAAIEEKWGLNKPLHQQYLLHMSKLLVFDSMESRQQKNKTLRDVIREQMPTSLRLGARALILAIVFGVPIGVLCAVYHNRVADNAGSVMALMGVSVPNFIIASLLIFFLCQPWEIAPGIKWNPFPAIGWNRPTEVVYLFGREIVLIPASATGFKRAVLEEIFRLRLWIPAIALGAFSFAAVLRLTRSSMLDALSQDYVRTARAKGVSSWKVVARHALRNALTPVVTFLGPVTAGVLTGSLVVEQIFAIPNLGKFFIDSVNNRDMPIIMGVTVFYSALLIFMNLLVDAIYPILNPRLRK